ncbi:MAG: MaoC family dehydratase [Rhodospirillales bacterium]|nr:MaoC family dehydratase [Rhodospirillales bacterium]MCW9039599.1 MaoC family dehydratase [Rhodospirillales bacterium]
MGKDMLVLETPQSIKEHLDREMGPSEWITIDQPMIDKFADATGDHQWIHVDAERAAREMPGGKTIAHGFLTLSLLPRMMGSLYSIKAVGQRINYGSDKVRFTSMVPAGSRVRLRLTPRKAEDVKGGGVRITSEAVIEIEGADRPALVAEVITVAYP